MKNNKKIRTTAAILGMVGTLALTGCANSIHKNNLVDEIKEDPNKKEYYLSDNSINQIGQSYGNYPYEIYDVSYYYDENNQLHELTESSLIKTTKEKTLYYVPENIQIKEIDGEEKAFKTVIVQSKIDGKLTESQITKEVQIIDSNYNIDVYDTPDFNINDVDELAYQVFENNYYAYRIHVYINEYFVPEGAYIIDHGDLPPTKCYFDNIIEREQSLSKKIK